MVGPPAPLPSHAKQLPTEDLIPMAETRVSGLPGVQQDPRALCGSTQDTVILADVSFVKLLENLAPKLRTVRDIIFLTDERCVGGAGGGEGVLQPGGRWCIQGSREQ